MYKVIPVKKFVENDGELISFESDSTIPFIIKRMFLIKNVPSDSIRGNHACLNSKFVFFMISGSALIEIDDGISINTIKLTDNKTMIYISEEQWIKIHSFSSNAILQVFASEFYKESDYINDYQKFRQIAIRSKL